MRRVRIYSGIGIALSGLLIVYLCLPTVFVLGQDVGAGGIGGRPAYPREDNQRSESIFIHSIDNGASATDGVRVVNNTDTERTILVYATDSVRSSGGAFACAQFVDDKTDVGSWITLEQERITLEPSSSEVINFTIDVPYNADAGEHNGCIVVQEDIPATESSQGIGLNFRTATRVAIFVAGDLGRADLAKQLFIIDVRTEIESSNVVITPVLENRGVVSVDADIATRIKTFFGNELSLVGGEYPVLRNEVGEWNFKHPRPFWGGFYKVDVDATYDQNVDNFIGDANPDLVTINYPTFWLFIMPTVLALFIIVIILIILCYLLYKWLQNKREQRQIHKTWKKHTLKKSVNIKVIAKSRNMSWKKLAKINKLKPPYHLEAGQTILIPPKSDKKE